MGSPVASAARPGKRRSRLRACEGAQEVLKGLDTSASALSAVANPSQRPAANSEIRTGEIRPLLGEFMPLGA
jgi:hypothetical protein